ncbi:MAG: Gfo/Idh/MocA family oxidoreductase [bacterium]
MPNRINIISIGGGWVVNNRHIPALQQSGLFDIVGVVSKNPDHAQATARKHGIPNSALAVDFSGGWQAKAEAVMIGTWPETHYEIAKAALLAGKHVLTEKPMTVKQEHAVELAAMARERKLTLALVHNLQFGRAAQSLRRDLASGRLGPIRAVYGVQVSNHARKIPAWCHALPLGLFYDEAPHFYYLFRWLAGDMELLQSTVWKDGRHDHTPRIVSAEYRAAKGFPVFLHVNFDSSITEWHITVIAEKGVAHLDMWRDIYHFLPNDGVHGAKDIFMKSIRMTTQHLRGVWANGLLYVRGGYLCGNNEVVSRFHRAIRGEDCLQGMNAEEGQRVTGMMHEVIAKARYFE